MTAWRGKLASLLPDSGWRKIVDFSRPVQQSSTRSIAQLRSDNHGQVSAIIGGLEIPVTEFNSEFLVSSSDASSLVASLEKCGIVLYRLPRTALSSNAVSGWVAASSSVVGKRRDLAEAIGARITETVDGSISGDPNVLDFVSPVDLVYTWVDGSDNDWQDSKDRALQESDPLVLPTSADRARFESNDELMYSLRSVESFLPWVNHVYIVTAGQKPNWLPNKHPKVTVVPHEAIFRKVSDLPTFNSHAIESQLHRIPGLSEHFVYVNDDVMFGCAMRPEVFFTASGQSKFVLSERHYESDAENGLPVNLAARNNGQVIRDRFGHCTTFKFKHVAHAQLKSTLERIESENADLVAATAAAKFRSATDLSIPSSLAHYYGAALGLAVPGAVSYKYVDLGEGRAQIELSKLAMTKRPQIICLNQVAGSSSSLSKQRETVRHFLENYYPWPSSMEVAGKS